jgi:hypothetical protein
MPARLAAVILFAFACTGCFRATTLVTVRPDGSGTIDQEMGMKPETVAMLKSMAGAGGGQGTKGVSGELFTEKQARETADKIGARFVSGEPLKTADVEGYRAHYAFDDITKLQMKMGQQEAQMAEASGDKADTSKPPLVFELAKGTSSSTLTIRLPEQTETGPLSQLPVDSSQDAAQNAQALAMVKTMMAGLFVDFTLAIDGKVVKSSMPLNGNRLTLLQMDFDKMLQDPTALQKLKGSKSLAALQGVPGLTVPSANTLTIEFAK